MARETLDDDADLLYIGLHVVGRHSAEVGLVGQGLRGHGVSPCPWNGIGGRRAGGTYPRSSGEGMDGGRRAGHTYHACRSGDERPALQHACYDVSVGGEHACAPRDDLGCAAHAPQRRQVRIGRPLNLDPVGAHQAPAREPPAVGERKRVTHTPKTLAPVIASPPLRPKLARTERTCSASSTRLMNALPSSEVTHRVMAGTLWRCNPSRKAHQRSTPASRVIICLN